MKTTLLIIITFFLQHFCLAQQIKGHIIDPVNLDTLSGVHIYNQSKDLGALSDSNGFFHISAHLDDTIHFFHKGHYPILLIVRKHHYWTSLLMHLERHTILLNGTALQEERLQMVANKYRTPIFIAGLTDRPAEFSNSTEKSQINTLRSSIFNNSKLKNDVKEAYSLTDDQLKNIIAAFYQQQKRLLKVQNKREVISYFLQFVEAKTRKNDTP